MCGNDAKGKNRLDRSADQENTAQIGYFNSKTCRI